MEDVSKDLRAILADLAVAWRKERMSKRWLSHTLAKSFVDDLEREGAKILETTTGNANYFCVEISGAPVAVSPFGSHEGFWEKLSDGFRTRKDELGCRWGVVLFVLPEKRGLWIEGNDYDAYVLRGGEKVHSFEVERAEKLGKAQPFYDSKEFFELISKGPKLRARTMLVKKPKKSTSKGES
jgi:hypothetical protein